MTPIENNTAGDVRRVIAHVSAAIIIIAATYCALSPVLENDFVNWGDVQDITSNEHYRGFGLGKLRWMFTTIQMGHWQPLSWLTFALDYEIAGMDARQYHLSSLVYHAVASVMVYFLVLALLRAAWGDVMRRNWVVPIASLAGALLFAVHPLRVEPVAWATERRGPVSAIFYFGAVLCYLSYARRLSAAPSMTRSVMYWAAVACMIVSLLAKEFGVSLPVVLLAIDIYPLRRLNWSLRDWMRPEKWNILFEKAPFVVVAALGTWIALAAAAQSGVAKSVTDYGLLQRVMQACYGLIFYLEKTIWPANLSNLYPIPPGMNPFESQYLIGAAGVAIITVGLIALRNRWPAGLVMWICYIVILLPVLGLVQTGRQIAADRYMYLPAAGLSALVAGGLVWLWTGANRTSIGRVARWMVPFMGGIAVVSLALASQRQCRVWRDSATLWTHALKVNPSDAVAHNNMAVVLSEQNDVIAAAHHLEQALQLDPNYADAHSNLGTLFAMQGRMDDAIEQWKKALAIDPELGSAKAHLEQVEKRGR